MGRVFLTVARVIAARASLGTTTALAFILAVGCGSNRIATRARHPTQGAVTSAFAGLHPVEHVSRSCAGGGILGTQGSLGGVPIPENPEIFRVTNIWHKEKGAIDTDVHAGAFIAHPERGILLVSWTNQNLAKTDSKSGPYAPREDTGPLVLTCVRSKTVFFRFRHGRGTFDLTTRRFKIDRYANSR